MQRSAIRTTPSQLEQLSQSGWQNWLPSSNETDLAGQGLITPCPSLTREFHIQSPDELLRNINYVNLRE